MLRQKAFKTANDLVEWVNSNPKQINVHGICTDAFGDFILFYSITGEMVTDNDEPIDMELTDGGLEELRKRRNSFKNTKFYD